MPFYDLHCTSCDKDFNLKASIAEKMEKRVLCPECGSNKMETIYKPINVHVKKDTASACPNSHVCGAGCRHGH